MKPASTKDDSSRLKFERNLSYRVSMLNFLMGKVTKEIYNAQGLTSHQWKVLSVVDAFAPIPAYEIAKWVTLDKAAISRAVRQLRDLRLVDLRPHATDARIIDIVMTKKGTQTYATMNKHASKLQARLLGGLSAERQALFFSILDEIEARLRPER
jgi:DNA-binding MarR family transcriptional regulator